MKNGTPKNADERVNSKAVPCSKFKTEYFLKIIPFQNKRQHSPREKCFIMIRFNSFLICTLEEYEPNELIL